MNQEIELADLCVVSTCAPADRPKYAARCEVSWFEGFPPYTPIIYYSDEDMEVNSPWLAAFKARHKDNPDYNGRRSYLHNAVKFAHKVAAILMADRATLCPYLLWLDADVFMHAPATEAAVKSWMPGPHDWLSWLPRDPKVIHYPECGFLLFNRRVSMHQIFMRYIEHLYASDDLLQLPETHDSYVWKHVVETQHAATKSLSGPGFSSMHPFINGPLGEWFDHMKGPSRKQAGRSPVYDLRGKRTEPYWS